MNENHPRNAGPKGLLGMRDGAGLVARTREESTRRAKTPLTLKSPTEKVETPGQSPPSPAGAVPLPALYHQDSGGALLPLPGHGGSRRRKKKKVTGSQKFPNNDQNPPPGGEGSSSLARPAQ